MKPLPLIAAALVGLACHSVHGAEAFEVAAGGEDNLPQGKEADGIRGDFVLRNDKIIALISQNAPLRRANMSTFYGADGVTPGCLYDLTLREAQNDQITCFSPAGQRGQVSWVRIVPNADKDKKSASVETVITSAKNGGIYKRHEYRVHDGEQGVWIITTVRNETREKQRVVTKDEWTKFLETGMSDGIRWAGAVDPDDRCGYACGSTAAARHLVEEDHLELQPGQEISWGRFLAVARSPVEAWSLVEEARGATKLGKVKATIKDAHGVPVPHGRIGFSFPASVDRNGNPPDLFEMPRDNLVPAYADNDGVIEMSLPVGQQNCLFCYGQRISSQASFKVVAGRSITGNVTVPALAKLNFAITREDGSPVPCKAQILATGSTLPLDLGPAVRAHGCRDQYHSENGHFSILVPPGSYHIVVTHGIEFNHHEQDITPGGGEEIEIKATLKRLVDTTGWVSADFHNHSTQSGDNVCGTPDRIINLAAEQIEFAPTTEHNRIYDWRPIIEKLGLQKEMQTVVGMELTGAAAHLNCFPLTVEPFTQDNGAPVWNPDPRIAALTLRGWQGERDDRWIQINHPDHQFLFNDRNKDGVPDGGFAGIDQMVDGMETENFVGDGILADSPWRLRKLPGALATQVEYVRQFIWLQLLNLGYRIKPIAVSDAHSVYGNGVGGWRMYLPSKTDDPSQIDWTGDLVHQAKAGHYILTTGPFLQVTTSDGKLPGDEVKSPGGVDLKVRVQCTEWQDIDRVQVLVNGRQEPSLNFTRQTHPQMFQNGIVKFEQTLHVPLKTDAHLIVVAMHQTMTLKTGYGTSDQSSMHPMAYHTPIYVIVEGDHFKPNGDTLGYDIPVMKMTPDIVRKKLGLPEPEAGK